MDTVVRLKQVIYWPNFVTRGGGGGGRRRSFVYSILQWVCSTPNV